MSQTTNEKSSSGSSTTNLTAKQVTQGVISFLTRHKRLGLLPQIANQALKVARPQTDPNTAIVESVVPLSTSHLESIRSWLKTEFNRDNLEIVNKTNPNLIAGIKIKVADLVIDQSIATQIDQLVSLK